MEAASATADDLAEAELVAQLKAGNEEAFAQLVRTHGPRMLAVTRRFLHEEHDAQDAVQDAFLSAFRSISSFAGQSRLATWLHRIAVNSALMKLRTQKRHPERSIDDLLPKYHADGHRAEAGDGWAVTHDTAVADRETRELVHRSIDDLPDTHRAILLLRDIEERSTEETAALLGLSVPAVKTRLHRARQALRTLLDPYLDGGQR